MSTYSEGAYPYDGGELDKPDPILTVDGLRKEFGGLVAVEDVSLAVQEGSITGLIGPNGAGKSTLFNLVSGFYEPDDGSVTFDGADVTGRSPDAIARSGLVRTFQTPRKLEGMTVRENLLVGTQRQAGESLLSLWTSPGRVLEDERTNLERAEEALELFELGHLATEPATELSGGQYKLLELARAMTTDPDLLLLDEPVSGVNPTLAGKLAEHIRALNEQQGLTVFVIEHDIDFVMDLADPVIVLDQGKVLTEGSPAEVRSDDRVMEAYLGGANR